MVHVHAIYSDAKLSWAICVTHDLSDFDFQYFCGLLDRYKMISNYYSCHR